MEIGDKGGGLKACQNKCNLGGQGARGIRGLQGDLTGCMLGEPSTTQATQIDTHKEIKPTFRNMNLKVKPIFILMVS